MNYKSPLSDDPTQRQARYQPYPRAPHLPAPVALEQVLVKSIECFAQLLSGKG